MKRPISSSSNIRMGKLYAPRRIKHLKEEHATVRRDLNPVAILCFPVGGMIKPVDYYEAVEA